MFAFGTDVRSHSGQLARRLFLFLAVLSLLLRISAAAAEAETNLHAITITVIDAKTGLPISGANVSVPTFGPVLRNAPTNAWQGVTDSVGTTVAQVSRLTFVNMLTISVEHTNYAPRQARWFSGNRPGRVTLPTAYTFKLERGVTIGGFVRNEKGEPVAGATVVLWGENFVYSNDPSQAQRQQDYSALARDDRNGVLTDANGFWSRPSFPADLERFRIDVVRPGGARTLFATEGALGRFNEIAKEVRLADFRATNAVLAVPEGATIRGIIVDRARRPVPNVRVKERRGRGSQQPMFELTNNSDGRFELPHRDNAQYVLTAEAEKFAIKSVVVRPEPAMPELRIVMPEAKPLRLRIVSEKDEPVPSHLQVLDWRTEKQVLDWQANTDNDGRVVWTNAPDQEVTFSIGSTNYPYRALRVTADGTEKIVRLRKTSQQLDIRIKATDAQSGQPLPRFEVWKNVQYQDSFAFWAGVTNAAGELRTNLTMDPQRGYGTLRVQVRADGYAPWTSSQAYFDEGDQEFTAALIKAAPPRGIVLQPDGQPAVNAKLLLNTGAQPLFANRSGSDFYVNAGVLTRYSINDGSFQFPPAEDQNRILVVHPTGFASVAVEELRRNREVRLKAWGRVEGVLRAGGKPLANERIILKSPINWLGAEGYSISVLIPTDNNGAFTFTNLPPGEYMLHRLPILISGLPNTESHPWPFDLAAGETKKIDYTFGGRTVVGHIEIDANVDWQNDPHLLTLKLPAPPPQPSYYDFVDAQEFEKERKLYPKLPGVKEYDRKQRRFQLIFDRDGNFKVEDVPAGTYELRVRVTNPPKDPNMRYQRTEEELGLLVKEVTIPPGAPGEEFDLGNFEMESKGGGKNAVAPQTLAGVRATTFDGKAFDLESLRGKPAVLLFWANWAPKSAARLADLRALQESTNSAVPIVTINLDDDSAAAQKALRDLKRGIHTRLEGRARFEITEQSGIDTLPLTLVLDAQGRVVARDVEGKRLRSVVDRAVAKASGKQEKS